MTSASVRAGGACNIGADGAASRRRLGVLGLVAAAALALLLVAAGAPPLARLAVAAPLAGGLLGVVQARRGFCIGLALTGRRETPAGAIAIVGRGERAADLAAALRLATPVAACAGLAALALAALPLG